MLACSEVWLPISMPASAMRLALPGSRATLLPIRKKVALVSLHTSIDDADEQTRNALAREGFGIRWSAPVGRTRQLHNAIAA